MTTPSACAWGRCIRSWRAPGRGIGCRGGPFPPSTAATPSAFRMRWRRRRFLPGNGLDDGLPQSLAACIRAYGLSQFKIKFTSDRVQSIPRLRRIVEIIARETGGRFAASLDGNESFKTVGEFRAYWTEARALTALDPLFGNLLFVEQPFHRDIALGNEVGAALRGWAGRPAVIIDESDAEIGSLPRALECGYAGTSHKNCKGVIRGVANACLLERRRRVEKRPFLMSAEDLTTIGPVALLQDLAVQAALGNESVERNGHHYFRGLSFWPEGDPTANAGRPRRPLPAFGRRRAHSCGWSGES